MSRSLFAGDVQDITGVVDVPDRGAWSGFRTTGSERNLTANLKLDSKIASSGEAIPMPPTLMAGHNFLWKEMRLLPIPKPGPGLDATARYSPSPSTIQIAGQACKAARLDVYRHYSPSLS